jgi:hypothetical protein
MAVTQQRMGLEEFLRLPEEKPALEYLEIRAHRRGAVQIAPEAITARSRRVRRAYAATPGRKLPIRAG